MSGLPAADRSSRTVPRGARWVGLMVAAAIVLTVGYAIGHSDSDPEWRQGSAHVGTDQASITVDDWTYGISTSVAWIDRSGSRHEDGWPECLDVPAGTTVEGVRFATVAVEVDGDGWREVVLVDCR